MLRNFALFHTIIKKREEINFMKRQIISLINRLIPDALVIMGRFFAVVGANSCCCIFHQPDKPNLDELRKF